MAFAAMQMCGIGGELPRFGQRVHSDLFSARVVKAQEPRFLPDPNLASDVFGWCRVISAFELHVAVAMHRAQRFLEDWKQTRRQWVQCGLLDLLKELAHLLARRAVDPRVGYVLFPVGQEPILR